MAAWQKVPEKEFAERMDMNPEKNGEVPGSTGGNGAAIRACGKKGAYLPLTTDRDIFTDANGVTYHAVRSCDLALIRDK